MSSFIDKAKELWKRFYERFVGPHGRMERFVAEAAILTVAMTAILVAGVAFYVDSQIVNLAETAIYTPGFTTTKSKASGRVVSCGSDSSRRHAYLLVRFDSPSQISLDPAQWRIILGHSDIQGNSNEAICVPDGRITFYSDSGYALVTMDSIDEHTFPNTVLDVRLETRARITGASADVQDAINEAIVNTEFDGSDFLRVDINPVAADAVNADPYMVGDTIDPDAVYRAEVVSADEDNAREAVRQNLTALSQAWARIEEYDTRASQLDITHEGGTALAIINADKIDEEAGTFTRTDDVSGTDILVNGDRVAEGGSYVATAKGTFDDAESLMDKITEDVGKSSDLTFGDVVWKVAGEPYDTSKMGRTAAQKAEQAKANLESAWSNYISARKNYLSSLTKLLEIEADADAASAYKVTSEEDQLWIA